MQIDFPAEYHSGTKRDYYGRMNSEKPECMRIAKESGQPYRDGGYGGDYGFIYFTWRI
jgi:hypothetical protein